MTTNDEIYKDERGLKRGAIQKRKIETETEILDVDAV
jgi:hypothetical protein